MKIVNISPDILITIYAYDNKTWFDRTFPSDQIVLDSYNHREPEKLRDNILFLDSDKYNQHSTSLEIIRLKIPLIAFQSNEYYCDLHE